MRGSQRPDGDGTTVMRRGSGRGVSRRDARDAVGATARPAATARLRLGLAAPPAGQRPGGDVDRPAADRHGGAGPVARRSPSSRRRASSGSSPTGSSSIARMSSSLFSRPSALRISSSRWQRRELARRQRALAWLRLELLDLRAADSHSIVNSWTACRRPCRRADHDTNSRVDQLAAAHVRYLIHSVVSLTEMHPSTHCDVDGRRSLPHPARAIAADGVSTRVHGALCCAAYGARAPKREVDDDGTRPGVPRVRSRRRPRRRRPPPPPQRRPPRGRRQLDAPPPAAAPGGFQTAGRWPSRRARLRASPTPSSSTRIVAFIIDCIRAPVAFVGFVARVDLPRRSSSMAASASALIVGVLGRHRHRGDQRRLLHLRLDDRMRASLGQKVLGLETVSATDGVDADPPQAIRRWLFLFGIVALASALSPRSSRRRSARSHRCSGCGLRVRDLTCCTRRPRAPSARATTTSRPDTVVVKRAA